MICFSQDLELHSTVTKNPKTFSRPQAVEKAPIPVLLDVSTAFDTSDNNVVTLLRLEHIIVLGWLKL